MRYPVQLFILVVFSAGLLEAQSIFYETGEKVLIEAESAPKNGWTLETEFDGYTGSRYYRWKGGGSYGSPPGDANELQYRFVIANPGRYQIRMHNRHETSNHDANDVWLAMDDGTFYKAFAIIGHRWTWFSQIETPSRVNIYYDLSAGEHTLRLRPRSSGFAFDKIIMYTTKLPYGQELYHQISPQSPTEPVPVSEYVYNAAAFDFEGKGYSQAGPYLQLDPSSSTTGTASIMFNGASGLYHMDFMGMGEKKGCSHFKLTVGNQSFEYDMPGSWKEREAGLDYLWFIPEVKINRGDTIVVQGTSENGTLAAWGRLTLYTKDPAATAVPTPLRPALISEIATTPRWFLLNGRRTHGACIRNRTSHMLTGVSEKGNAPHIIF